MLMNEMALDLKYDGADIEAFAKSYDSSWNDPKFKRAFWNATETFRAQTKLQVVVRNNKIRILEPEQLARYARSGRATAHRKVVRSLDRAKCVAVTQLPEDDRASHARFIERCEREIAAISLSNRKLAKLVEDRRAEIEAQQKDSEARLREHRLSRGKKG